MAVVAATGCTHPPAPMPPVAAFIRCVLLRAIDQCVIFACEWLAQSPPVVLTGPLCRRLRSTRMRFSPRCHERRGSGAASASCPTPREMTTPQMVHRGLAPALLLTPPSQSHHACIFILALHLPTTQRERCSFCASLLAKLSMYKLILICFLPCQCLHFNV